MLLPEVKFVSAEGTLGVLKYVGFKVFKEELMA